MRVRHVAGSRRLSPCPDPPRIAGGRQRTAASEEPQAVGPKPVALDLGVVEGDGFGVFFVPALGPLLVTRFLAPDAQGAAEGVLDRVRQVESGPFGMRQKLRVDLNLADDFSTLVHGLSPLTQQCMTAGGGRKTHPGPIMRSGRTSS